MLVTSLSTLETTHNDPRSRTVISYQLSNGGYFCDKGKKSSLNHEEALMQTFRTNFFSIIYEGAQFEAPSITISVRHFSKVADEATVEKARNATRALVTVQKTPTFEPALDPSTPLSTELPRRSAIVSSEELEPSLSVRSLEKTFAYPFPPSVSIFCDEKETRINPNF